MDTTRSTMLQSLANTISDYRKGEIAPITPAHVERCLNQFDSKDQPVILTEMDVIMKQFYFSRSRVKECIRAFLKEKIIRNNDPKQLLPHVSFLNIQRRGSSQSIMVELAYEVLHEEYSYSLSATDTQEVKTCIYLDDGIYTGSKIRYDLTDGSDTTGWLSICPYPGCTLWVYTIAGHVEGIEYARKYILDAALSKRINVYRETTMMLDNSRRPGSNIEMLWPENLHDPYVDSYVSELEAALIQRGWFADIFRSTTPVQEKLFSSPAARRVVEQAFLKKGIQLVKASRNPAPSIRPLGFMKLISLGFGTFFVIYRNIANNCPLVLWWGDPNLPPTHPIGQWYPLFPRRTNEQRDIIGYEQIFNEPF